MNDNYIFKVGEFSGPFDLLLQLAKDHEIEICEVCLDDLINQYLDFISKVQEEGLDIRSSYLEMAAELLRLKSASLLQLDNELDLDMEEELVIDRQEMIRRILEYKRYKEIVPELNQLIDERDNYLTREPDNLCEFRNDNFKNNFDINKFYKAVELFLAHQQEDLEEKIIEVKELNVEKFINYLRQIDKPLHFSEVIKKASKNEFVVLFLACLECLKLNYITVKEDKQHIVTIYPGENDE